MTGSSTPEATAHESTESCARAFVESYVDALAARDIQRCVDLYDETAVLELPSGAVSGAQAIELFHRERFAASLEVRRVRRIVADGDTVQVDASVTSRVIRAIGVGALPVRVTFWLRDGKIRRAKGGLQPLRPWR